KVMVLSSAKALALTRIAVGVYFLVQAFGKTSWFTNSDGLLNMLVGNPSAQPARAGMIQSAETFYKPFLENVVVPNAAVFAPLVALGEFTVGVTLVLGLFTRLGAIVAMWLTLNYMLAKGLAAGG